MSILQTTIDNIVAWGDARGFYGKGGTTAIKQGLKGIEEIGEVAKAYNKNDLEELKLEIGDVGVCGIHVHKLAGSDMWVSLETLEVRVYYAKEHKKRYNKDESMGVCLNYLVTDLVHYKWYHLEDLMADLKFLAELNGFTLEECLVGAYEKIKDRKGRMVNGVWVKEV